MKQKKLFIIFGFILLFNSSFSYTVAFNANFARESFKTVIYAPWYFYKYLSTIKPKTLPGQIAVQVITSIFLDASRSFIFPLAIKHVLLTRSQRDYMAVKNKIDELNDRMKTLDQNMKLHRKRDPQLFKRLQAKYNLMLANQGKLIAQIPTLEDSTDKENKR